MGTVLRERGYTILALGANQGGYLRFQTSKRTWKWPDLVAIRERETVVGEAKCVASHLFTRSRGRLSDCESLVWLASGSNAVNLLARVAYRASRLGLALPDPPQLRLIPCLVAGSPFGGLMPGVEPVELLCIEVDLAVPSVSVVNGTL